MICGPYDRHSFGGRTLVLILGNASGTGRSYKMCLSHGRLQNRYNVIFPGFEPCEN